MTESTVDLQKGLDTWKQNLADELAVIINDISLKALSSVPMSINVKNKLKTAIDTYFDVLTESRDSSKKLTPVTYCWSHFDLTSDVCKSCVAKVKCVARRMVETPCYSLSFEKGSAECKGCELKELCEKNFALCEKDGLLRTTIAQASSQVSVRYDPKAKQDNAKDSSKERRILLKP